MLSGFALGQTAAPTGALLPGQTATLLPDGRWLLAGGVGQTGPQNQAVIVDTSAHTSTPAANRMARARAGHTATVLPEGVVLVLGGVDANGLVETAELFDPATLQFGALSIGSPSPRAYHTATVLTDGQLLVAGGVANGNALLRDAELWDSRTGTVTKVAAHLSVGRRDHTATLLSDGQVSLWGGHDQHGVALTNGDLYDSLTQTFTPIDVFPIPDHGSLRVAESLPADGDINVPTDTLISLRFSSVLAVATVNASTVTLTDDSQRTVSAKVVAIEGGMLAFILPQAPLVPSTIYTLSIDGATDPTNQPLAPATFTFSTVDDPSGSGIATAADKKAALDSTKEPDSLPPLKGPAGVTALAGRVLLSHNAKPLAGVSLELTCGSTSNAAKSDSTGRFLINAIPSGHCKLEIDGTSVASNKTYGIYFAGVDVMSGQTNVLPYFIWMTQIDTPHTVTIPSPTTAETVVSTPRLPGLELHLQPQTTITNYDGNVINQLSITKIPVARPPFPLPNVQVDFYFTIQPGGAYVKVNGTAPQGARLIYPNPTHAPAGFRMDFWNYDPDQKGWYIYGQGAVSADARSIVPDPGVVLYRFTGAMASSPSQTPPPSPNKNCNPNTPGCKNGDPVDLGTGHFGISKTDFALPGVVPIILTRSFTPRDTISRAFGVGASHPYNVFLSTLTSGPSQYSYMDLILSDGSRIHYAAVANSGIYQTVIFEHTGTQTPYYKSQINWNGSGWNLNFKDGSLWTFPDGFNKNSMQGGITGMTDRYGNGLTLARDLSTGNLNRIVSPSGRWINFSYDTAGRITQAQDNSGRTVSYSYDSGGRLNKVIDANGGITQYAYDPNDQLMTVTDPRNITYITNFYDGNGHLIEQDQADGGAYHFAYTLDASGNIIQVDVTNPRGFLERSAFDTSGYMSGGNLTSFIGAVGQPEQQTTTYQYDPAGTGLMQSSTDPLGRQTTFAYDSCGNMTGITRLAGTGNAVTTTLTYQTGTGTYPCLTVFNQVTSMTDPLSHTTNFGYDTVTNKNLTSVTDALQHSVTIVPNSNGQPASVTDFAGTTHFGYSNGDLVTTTNPTNNMTTRTLDLAGRLVRLQSPLGQVTQYQYDALNGLVKITDPLNGQANFSYDGNGNLVSVQDALTHTTTYTPNSMDRVASRKDALLNLETYQYDLNGNPSVFVDRKNQVTSNTYDGLGRLIQVQFTDLSTISYTYDAGNRVTQIVDSLNGTITRTYDGLNRLTSETTAQGSVSYTYDAANRRATMTVAGQPVVNYTYDNANRLTQISQATATVTIAYDNAYRHTSLTLPNGVVAAYGYDTASRLISITYTLGVTTLGNLTYTYDANSRVVQSGGSLARVNLSTVLSSAAYNANNQLTQSGLTTLTYDLDGNLANDGTTAYTWNARNQLGAFGATSFAYDAVGRRTRNASGVAFLYDGVNAVQELSGTTVTANLLTGLGVDEIFTRTDSGGAWNFLADGLGSALALTDSTGTMQTQYTYEPFGKTTIGGTANTSTFQYTGRENDGTGLYYYRARYYSPTLQRFVSEDPLGFTAGDVNVYQYGSNAPLSFTDPSGLESGQTFKSLWGTPPPPPAGPFLPNFKYYGNWGGPGWTGGSLRPYEDMTPAELASLLPPIDPQDQCYQDHDLCYSRSRVRNCTTSGDSPTPANQAAAGRDNAACDTQLYVCLRTLPTQDLHSLLSQMLFGFRSLLQ